MGSYRDSNDIALYSLGMEVDMEDLEDIIREEAYCIYATRIKQRPPIPGNDVSDWLQAEEKILSRNYEDMLCQRHIFQLMRSIDE